MALTFDKGYDASKLVKNLAKRHKLVNHLDRALEGFNDPFKFNWTDKLPDDAWHPSGDCTPSVDSLYDKATLPFEKIPNTPSASKNFLVGHFWHQLMQYIVLEKLKFCEPKAIERRGTKWWGPVVRSLEIPWENHHGLVKAFPEEKDLNKQWGKALPYHWVTGAGDIAPCSIPKHGDYIVDFKTMGSSQFKQSSVPDWVADKYEAQINIYMDLFDQERGLIVAINKDSGHEMKEFEYVRNQPLIDMIYDKWQFVSDCIDTGECPTVETNENGDEMDLFPLPFTGPVVQ